MTTALDIRRNTVRRYNPQSTYCGQNAMAYGGMRGSLVNTLTTKNGLTTVGGGSPNRNSWSVPNVNCAHMEPGRLLNRRFHKVNLRLSAPTPGEEDLYKHWNNNRGNKMRVQSAVAQRKPVAYHQIALVSQLPGQNDRPNTTQVPIRGNMYTPPTTPNGELVSEKDLSPPPSPQTSSSLFVNNRTSSMRCRGSTSSRSKPNSPNCNKNDNDIKSRTTNVRPMSANWRRRNRSPQSNFSRQPNRRWSFSETKNCREDGNGDGDSAYSSSRDVNTDKSNISPVAIRKSKLNTNTPPSTPGNRTDDNRKNTKTVSFKEDVLRTEGQQLRRRGGSTAFYYPNERTSTPERPYTAQKFSPNKRPVPPQIRPQTQPASAQQRRLATCIEDPAAEQTKPIPVNAMRQQQQYAGAKIFPLSLADYDILRQHNQSSKSKPSQVAQFTKLCCWNPYLNPDTGRRILSWLSNVEENPEVYYGFETDLFIK